jgi:hypothetical protein
VSPDLRRPAGGKRSKPYRIFIPSTQSRFVVTLPHPKKDLPRDLVRTCPEAPQV